MIILPYKDKNPLIAQSAYIAPNVSIIGDVEIGPGSSVWFGCTIRGDVNHIRIGARTNVQDNSVLHVASQRYGTVLGDDVTVGHGAILHACTVKDGGFVGMQACVMDGAVIEEKAMVAAGALVTPGKIIPGGELWGGRPARFMRGLTGDELRYIEHSARLYADLARQYKAQQG